MKRAGWIFGEEKLNEGPDTTWLEARDLSGRKLFWEELVKDI